MIKLKSQTFYYFYLSEENEIYISEEVPILDDEKKGWYHPKLGYRCYLTPLYIGDPVSSENVLEFYDFKEEKEHA